MLQEDTKLTRQESLDSPAKFGDLPDISQDPLADKILGATFEHRLHDCEEETHIQNKESRVLLIVTGGTLTMVHSQHGYVAARGLAGRLKKNVTLHDEEYASRRRSAAGDDWLVTPVSSFGKHIRYRVLEFEHLIDSSNIKIEDQVAIAQTIFDNYNEYDGFVVIHGTDTMAYTASVVSFILENLNKSVVFTGSQIPITELRNDAVDNLLGALLVAGPYIIPEVVLFFGNKLFRGNRATKEDSLMMEAFNSPNMEPLARFGVNFNIAWDQILPLHHEKLAIQ